MDQYPSPYVSVVPRILPSQYPSKKIPINDESNQYIENNSLRSYTSPTTMLNRSVNYPPLSTRTQIINNNELNQQENPLSSPSFVSNNIENPLHGRTNSRIHHEPLKGNSGDIIRRNSYSNYVYPNNYDYGLYDNLRRNSNQDNRNDKMSINGYIIIIAIIIGLFALTALAISIYLLVRITTT
ncbi:unnamed protein product [Rotaria sp. Silwood2]|nr:unnamed protein product [Rotaria sp. Silwood2]CAF3161549.1 unnamed protein product [Rotaria sp. Silwood2]CAF4387612.1 unnamed protein product [Rotaria sp. Silwood2]CAF4535674.1 unnamed protein product [Rotaria sp. Silwood2]